MAHVFDGKLCGCSAWCMIARRVSKPNICRLLMLAPWGGERHGGGGGARCFIACENIGGNLNFHVSNTFLCLHAFGNMGGG